MPKTIDVSLIGVYMNLYSLYEREFVYVFKICSVSEYIKVKAEKM